MSYEHQLLATRCGELSPPIQVMHALLGPQQVGKTAFAALMGGKGRPLETFFSRDATSWLV